VTARVTVAVVTTGLLIAACGSDPEPPGRQITEITFWDDNGGPARTPVWRHIIAEFEKAEPDIKVTYVPVPIAQVQRRYDQAVESGTLPDVGGVTTALLAHLSARKALEPLDDRIAGSSLDGKLNEQVLGLVKGAAPDGKIYAVPLSTNIGVFWYRSDWFDTAGLPPPRTWDQFFTDARRLTDAKRDRYGFTIRGGAGSVAQMLEVVYGQSGISTFFDSEGRSTLNDPKNVAALEKLVALYGKATPKSDITNDYTKMVAQFDSGRIAMMQHNLGSYNDHHKALPGRFAAIAVPRPAPAAKRTVVSNPVTGIGVFAAGDKQDAAFRFAAFAASEPMNAYWAERTGVIPANNDVVRESWVRRSQHLSMALDVLNDPATTVVQLPYYLPEFSTITKTTMEPLFQNVLLGDMSAQAFLDRGAAAFTEAQAAYKRRIG
jgi:multiple sugar transport system substrate-binding protein